VIVLLGGSLSSVVGLAQDSGRPSAAVAGTVSTRAVAYRQLPNMVADVTVGIEVYGRDLPETSRLLAQRSQALLEYLRAEKAERLRTDRVVVSPETQEARGQPPRVVGYAGRADVSFRTTPLRVPELLVGSLDHGANLVQQAGASPRDDEQDAARRDLAEEATRRGMAEAMAVAAAAGQRITGVQEIVVEAAGREQARARMTASPQLGRGAQPALPITIEAGDTEVSVSVSVKAKIGE